MRVATQRMDLSGQPPAKVDLLGLNQFGRSQSDMLGTDLGAFFRGGGDQGSPGQMVGFAEEAAGALVDGGYRLLAKNRVIQPGDSQVMVQVILHALPVYSLQVTSGDDPGR